MDTRGQAIQYVTCSYAPRVQKHVTSAGSRISFFFCRSHNHPYREFGELYVRKPCTCQACHRKMPKTTRSFGVNSVLCFITTVSPTDVDSSTGVDDNSVASAMRCIRTLL